MEDIGIIILNYNSSDHTVRCVNSIFLHSNSPLIYKIVIVDNNSRPEEFKKLDQLKGLDRVFIFRSPINTGFGAGNMLGVNFCSAMYYFFLNNDTLLLNDNLEILHDFMEKHPEAGISSGQMYNAEGNPGINFNYIPDLKLKLLGAGILRYFYRSGYPRKGRLFNEPVRVPVVNGSSLFVRASVFDKIGGFDPVFFLYCEEEDLAIRIKKEGSFCYLVPEARYTHLQGQSSISSSAINYPYLKEFYISQHYLYRKHFGVLAAWIWRLTQFIRSLRKFYRNKEYIKLAFLFLSGPSLKKSLRFKEIIRPEIKA